jgi:hypothetical protein
MPNFGNVEKLFDLIASELPEGMFAQDRADSATPAKRSISSSEIRAHATLLNDLYLQLKRVYDDKTILDAAVNPIVSLESVPRWERMLFAEIQDSGQTYAVRVANILAKIRASGGISLPVIRDIVSGLFEGTGLTFEIVTWSGMNGGAWILDESLLDVSTYLSAVDPNDYWNLNPDGSDWPSPEIYADAQDVAYRYELRIFGHADDALMARLEKVLTEFEPARSTHTIFNDFPGPIAP